VQYEGKIAKQTFDRRPQNAPAAEKNGIPLSFADRFPRCCLLLSYHVRPPFRWTVRYQRWERKQLLCRFIQRQDVSRRNVLPDLKLSGLRESKNSAADGCLLAIVTAEPGKNENERLRRDTLLPSKLLNLAPDVWD
jgi:hypothetical protein